MKICAWDKHGLSRYWETGCLELAEDIEGVEFCPYCDGRVKDVSKCHTDCKYFGDFEKCTDCIDRSKCVLEDW